MRLLPRVAIGLTSKQVLGKVQHLEDSGPTASNEIFAQLVMDLKPVVDTRRESGKKSYECRSIVASD